MFRGGGNQNMEECWSSVTFAYKFFFLSSLLLWVLQTFTDPTLLIDIPYMTVFQAQLWRPFFAFYGLFGMFSVIGILFAFLWLMRLLPYFEKKWSTAFIFVDIFLQNLIIHVIFNVIGVILLLLFEGDWKYEMFGYGWFPIIMIYIFREAAIDPESHTRFCCLPFLIKRKHLPWVLVIFAALFVYRFVIMFTAALLGYYQSFILKRNLIVLPISFYEKVEKILSCISQRSDFVRVSAAPQIKDHVCGAGPGSNRNRDSDDRPGFHFKNPFAGNNNNSNNNNSNNNRKQAHAFGGGGVAIGGEEVHAEVNMDRKSKNAYQNLNEQSKSSQDEEKKEKHMNEGYEYL